MRNGKSYIGFPLKNEAFIHSDADVRVIPVLSGYRKKETRELEITTNYSAVIRSLGAGAESLTVVLPSREIVSARLFDPELYEIFSGRTSLNA